LTKQVFVRQRKWISYDFFFQMSINRRIKLILFNTLTYCGTGPQYVNALTLYCSAGLTLNALKWCRGIDSVVFDLFVIDFWFFFIDEVPDVGAMQENKKNRKKCKNN
jgi:hypothetical protein